MNFPKFWARGGEGDFSCWRWSDRSAEEARTLAVEAARKLADRFRAGDLPRNRYGYADRPLREPVLREIRGGDGAPAAVITRNSYGCLVLNTAQVMFLDIDLPQLKPAGGFWSRLFAKPVPPGPNEAEAPALARIESWTRDRRDWSWRVYRTRAGLRLLAVHDIFDPVAAASDSFFAELGVDPLYRQLCKSQKCFRARLTPKPWRCAMPNPRDRWPFADAKAEGRFLAWQKRYERACQGMATCEFVRGIGTGRTHPLVGTVVDLHDEMSQAGSKLPLA